MAASVYERIALARLLLIEAGIEPGDAAFDAEVLARHVLGWDRASLIARWREAAPDGFANRFATIIARRAGREPVAYITGRREFWGLDFEVTPDVLIPRPETELIIEEAVRYGTEVRTPVEIIDVGTGSGCIAVALAREFPSARVTGTDNSPAALAVARRNAERLGAHITLLNCHLLETATSGADLIVSNPPYVPSVDAVDLQPEVGLHEPAGALFGGPDGLDLIRALFAAAAPSLARDGRLILEFGAGQETGLQEAAAAAGWQTVRLCNDLQGLPRVGVFRR
jgi:release factor glutamine methyltransferase